MENKQYINDGLISKHEYQKTLFLIKSAHYLDLNSRPPQLVYPSSCGCHSGFSLFLKLQPAMKTALTHDSKLQDYRQMMSAWW